MTKIYQLKALSPLLPLKREALPLLYSFDRFGDATQPWLVRWIVDSVGFWLQVNDHYTPNSPLSQQEFQDLSGFNPDDLEHTNLDGIGYRYGIPGGKPIFPVPFTAMQLFEFDRQLGGVVRDNFFLDTEEAHKQLVELEHGNPEAAELARIIFSGVMPEPQTTIPSPAPVVRETTEQAAPEQNTATPAPVVAAGASGGVEPDKAGLLPVEQGLSTKDIAIAFDGVNGWSFKRWRKNLSASKWLHPARIALGGAGGAASVWSPVMLAQLMHDDAKGKREKEKLMKVFNSRFTLNPVLGLWREAFNEYFATHCAAD